MSDLFRLNSSDFLKGLAMAVLGGFMLPILAAIQTPDFSIATINVQAVFVLAVNGALASFASYLVKNFFSDGNGAFLGMIGGNTR